MPHWRVVVHALDRTGPPMLALAVLRRLPELAPDVTFDVVAVRGGPLLDEAIATAPVLVLLDEAEYGLEDRDDPAVERARSRAATLPAADATLMVSVAAGQALPVLPGGGVHATWAVERGADLHWIDDVELLRPATDVWLAGSEGTRDELGSRLGPDATILLCPEFVEAPPAEPSELRERRRRALASSADGLLVVGAGIGTERKGVDLFVETVAVLRRAGSGPVDAVWIGGERDDFYWRVRSGAGASGLDAPRWFGSVSAIEGWLAAADVLLHTARLDSFPLVGLHAAAAGTPTVSFRGSGGTAEMFGAAFAGADYPDVRALAGAVDELRDPVRRAEVGAAQRRAVQPHLSAGPTVRVLTEVLAAAAAPGVER